MNKRIYILNGPTGVGKSTLSHLLMQSLPPACVIEGDAFANIHPLDHADSRTSLECNTLMAQAALFRLEHGIETIIINWVFETQASLQDLIQKLGPAQIIPMIFLLEASDSVFEKRILQRKTADYEWELKRFKELKAVFAERSLNGELGVRVDTSELSAEDVKEFVLKQSD